MHESDVSIIIPARNEEEYLPRTLTSIDALDTDVLHEVIVSDGGSEDDTLEIARAFDVRVVDEREYDLPVGGSGIAHGRNAGARAATGDWLAFVDADTVLRPVYLDSMLDFATEHDLAAASSYCRVVGPNRAKLMEWTINHVFSRLSTPILPGFNFFVRRDVFDQHGGFPSVPNEDTAFSRALGRVERTAYCPRVLVETSGRRIARSGLSGTLYHYLRLDVGRLRGSSDA